MSDNRSIENIFLLDDDYPKTSQLKTVSNSKPHPEQREDEFFYTNILISDIPKYENDSQYRIGEKAYNVYDLEIPEMVPVFKKSQS